MVCAGNKTPKSATPSIKIDQPQIKIDQVAIAEEALRRAKAAGSLPTEGGLRAAEERIDKIRKQAKVARAARVALAKREVPAVAAAAATRASQVRARERDWPPLVGRAILCKDCT